MPIFVIEIKLCVRDTIKE